MNERNINKITTFKNSEREGIKPVQKFKYLDGNQNHRENTFSLNNEFSETFHKTGNLAKVSMGQIRKE